MIKPVCDDAGDQCIWRVGADPGRQERGEGGVVRTVEDDPATMLPRQRVRRVRHLVERRAQQQLADVENTENITRRSATRPQPPERSGPAPAQIQPDAERDSGGAMPVYRIVFWAVGRGASY